MVVLEEYLIVCVSLCRAQAADETSIRVTLLGDLQGLFEGHDALPSETICNRLAELDERPWGEIRRGQPINPRRLASLLKPFSITPGSIRQPGSASTPKGYRGAQFAEAWASYLPGAPAATTPQPKLAVDFGVADSVADEIPKRHNATLPPHDSPQKSAGCGVVADKTPLEEGDDERAEARPRQIDLEDAIAAAVERDGDGDAAERGAIMEVDGRLEIPEFLKRR